jgi:hypothetical protein
MIVGITGVAESPDGTRVTAGSGKDTAAEQLVNKHGFVAVALADPMKRFCMEVFGFTEEQLWGPSEERNAPDMRYVRMYEGQLGSHLVGWNDDGTRRDDPSPVEDIHLTPRHALQQLGTEWGRRCYKEVWVDYALRVCHTLLTKGYWYDSQVGLIPAEDLRGLGMAPKMAPGGVVIPDLRFHNEAEKIREAGGQIWRVKRPINTMPAVDHTHGSEIELSSLPDEEFDRVLDNCKDIHHLHMVVDAIMARETGRIVDYDHEQRDVPPCKRDK